MDKKCSRTVLRSKLERNALETREWWNWLFTSMEANSAIPPDRRECVLKEIFPNEVFQEVFNILGVDENYENDDALFDKDNVDDTHSIRSDDTIDELHSEREAAERLTKVHKFNVKHDTRGTPSHASRISSEAIFQLGKKRKEIGPRNPYMRFQNRRIERAAIWYPKPPLLLEGMNLIQKADAITEQIAYDFIEWLKTITDPDEAPSNLTVLTIKKMFNIGFNTHAAKSLSVKMKEMASVPESVAKVVQVPEMSKRNQLHRQIRRDADAACRKSNNFAFGTKLPSEMIQIAPRVEDTRKWLVCDNVPKDLQSMATVWKGITHLRSTRAYCQYLLENPDICRPQYLVECNMLDPTFLRGPHVSIDSGQGDESHLILPPGVQEEEEQEAPPP